jgi:NAD(P)H dehydrogenase (quinone)
MILVTGAAGLTGTAVIAGLKRRGAEAAALSRGDSDAALKDAGAHQVRRADFRDEASLRVAMKGVSALYHICPRMQPDETEIGLRMITAAKAAGVGLFCYHSVIRAPKREIVFHWAKLEVEMALVASGLDYVILQPTNYMENVTWTWPLIRDEGRYLLPYSADKPLTWVAASDVGEAAARVLTDRALVNGTYELCGPDAPMSRHNICRVLSEQLGRSVVPETESIDAYFARPRFEGRPAEELARLRTMFEDYDRHGLAAGNGFVLSAILGRAPLSYADWLRRFLATR